MEHTDRGPGRGYPGPSWRPATSDIPTSPGVYRFRDDQGRIIYVGKAKNLRSRLVNYFQDPAALHPRTSQMVTNARSVQWTVVGSEVEALTLEFQWIKQYDPRFNVMFRDDKSYPYLAISLGEDVPRVAISRDAKKVGTRYYGPYTSAWAIRETIDLVLPTFPMRSCTQGVFRRAQSQGRPCLLGFIDRCSAPCVGRISLEDHRKIAEELCAFMDGDTADIVAQLRTQMMQASADLDFEEAANRRDQLEALAKVQEKNTLALSTDVNADFFALVADDLEASVHAFFVRAGRVRGTRGWVVERVDDSSEPQLMRDFLEQYYVEKLGKSPGMSTSPEAPRSVDDVAYLPAEAMPGQVLVSHSVPDPAGMNSLLSNLSGRSVKVSVPRRGKKAHLMETVNANATDALRLHKTKRSGDLTQRAVALEGLVEVLDLPTAPLRIECYDVSHTGGTNRVASMVVFEDGVPRKDQYRSFNIRGDEGQNQDDTAAMIEVLRRRFRTVSEEEKEELSSGAIDPETNLPRRFAYQPDLIVVDGGLPQVNAARSALLDVGVSLPVIGLAKRLEEVWVPGQKYPVIFARTSPSLYLLQHLRDESHRFAIQHHRKKRQKAQTRSVLDGIPGLGAARQQALLKQFGSLKQLRLATVEEIQMVPGFGRVLAESIFTELHENDQSKKVYPQGQ